MAELTLDEKRIAAKRILARQKASAQVEDSQTTQPEQPKNESFLDAAGGTVDALVGGAFNELNAGFQGLYELARTQDPDAAASLVKQIQQSRPVPSERTQGQLQDIGGVVETVADAVNVPLSGFAGLSELPFEGLDRAVQSVGNVQDQGFIKASGQRTLEQTDSPTLAAATEAGLTVLPDVLALKGAQVAGRGAERVADRLTDPVSSAVDSGVDAANYILDIQTPKRRSLTEALKKMDGTDELDIKTAGFELSPRGVAVKSPLEKKALKQHVSEQFITSLKTANAGDKQNIKRMVDITERRLRDPDFALDNRPSDVIGELVLNNFNTIKKANKRAGKEIDTVAQSLKGKPVNIEDAVLNFDKKLSEFGIELVDDGKGGLKPDFSMSELPPSDRGAIKEVIRQMNIQGKNGVDAFTAHKMKRIIDNDISYGKAMALSSDGQKMLRDFRKGIDDALDFTYPKYNRANLDYAETIRAIDAFQDSLPKKIDLDAPHADTAIGTDMRALLSNITSRQEKLNALKLIEDTAKKYSGDGKLLLEGKGGATPSIKKLIVAVDQLEDRFGSFAPTSFQGGIERGAAKGVNMAMEAKASPMTAAMRATAEITDKVRKITDENTFKALRELLNKEAQ